MKSTVVLQEWKAFIERGGVPEEKMSPIQRSEMKRAFYGAWAAAVFWMRDEAPQEDLGQTIALIKSTLEECQQYFCDETVRQNFGQNPS